MQKKLGIKNQGKTGKTRCVQINYKSFVRHTFTAKEYLQKQIFNLESKTKQKKCWTNINIANLKKMNMKNVPKTYNKIDLP